MFNENVQILRSMQSNVNQTENSLIQKHACTMKPVAYTDIHQHMVSKTPQTINIYRSHTRD